MGLCAKIDACVRRKSYTLCAPQEQYVVCVARAIRCVRRKSYTLCAPQEQYVVCAARAMLLCAARAMLNILCAARAMLAFFLSLFRGQGQPTAQQPVDVNYFPFI